MEILICLITILSIAFLLHKYSYGFYKNKVLNSKKWDLNICCGKTDGGGVNADIYKHTDLSNFVLLDSIYNLPFKDKQFKNLLCSHTIEHVEYPDIFFRELDRVSDNVTLIIPPLWDISAMLNVFEHKWIFLSFRKKHSKLPSYIRLPFSYAIQRRFSQVNNA